jgi:hypothetical protein
VQAGSTATFCGVVRSGVGLHGGREFHEPRGHDSPRGALFIAETAATPGVPGNLTLVVGSSATDETGNCGQEFEAESLGHDRAGEACDGSG